MKKNTITYEIGDKLYINLTNRCSNDCDFCIRRTNPNFYGYELWLDKEPTADEVIAEIEARGIGNYREIVFCGFGEPLYRYDAIKIIADYVHAHGGKTRINTNGQAAAILGHDITDEFPCYIDTVNVSLNATDKAKYQELCHSIFGEDSYDMMLEFARKLVGKMRVVLSIVDCVGAEEIERAKAIADSIGAELRVREEI